MFTPLVSSLSSWLDDLQCFDRIDLRPEVIRVKVYSDMYLSMV